jgi:tetratricopeptide (TPR) repeat protein
MSRTTPRRHLVAPIVGILGLALSGCSGHGEYTTEQTNAAKGKLQQLKSGLEYQTAMGDFHAGDMPKALRAIDRSIALNDKVAKTHVLRARVLMEIGNLEGALLSLQEAESIDATHVDTQYYFGVANERLERKPEAMARYSKAAEMDKSNAQYAIAASEVMMDLGQLEEAKRFLDGRGPLLAHNSAVRQTLGHIAMMQGETNKAVGLFNEARLLSPNDMGITEDLVRAQVASGFFADAELNLSRLLSHSENSKRRDLLHMRAKCLTEIERLVDAREILIKLSSDADGGADPEIWNDLGHVSVALGDMNRVRGASAKLIAIAPRRPEGHVLKAIWERKRGDNAAAKGSVVKALSLRRTSEGLLLLASIQQDLHDVPGARTSLAEAVKLDPGNTTAKQMLAAMEASRTASVPQ